MEVDWKSRLSRSHKDTGGPLSRGRGRLRSDYRPTCRSEGVSGLPMSFPSRPPKIVRRLDTGGRRGSGDLHRGLVHHHRYILPGKARRDMTETLDEK